MIAGPASSATIEARLRHELGKALRQARLCKHQVFLELYAGVGVVSAHLRKAGFAVVSFEISEGEHFDCLNPKVRSTIKG